MSILFRYVLRMEADDCFNLFFVFFQFIVKTFRIGVAFFRMFVVGMGLEIVEGIVWGFESR